METGVAKRQNGVGSSAQAGITTRQLARVSGISRYQLVTWAQAGLVRAIERKCGKRVEHVYTRDQALGIVALGELRNQVSGRRLREASAALPATASSCEYLLFDGRMMFGLRSADELAARLVDRVRACWVFRVGDLARRLAE